MTRKYKKTTSNTLYRPKTHSVYTYNRFLKQFLDPYTYGINNKQHFHSKKYINDSLTSPLIWHRNRAKVRFSNVESHYENQGTLYYTNHPGNALALFCLDIDVLKDDGNNILTTDADISAVSQYLLTLFPGCYYEPSSSGHGLHFYLLIDFEQTTLYKRSPTWGCTANQYICNDNLSLSKLLRRYINHRYNVTFDAIKASYSNYSYSSVDKKYIVDNCGVLCKCPRPNCDTASILYNTPIYSLSYIYQDIILSLFHLLSSNSLIDEEYVSSSSIASQAMREQHRHRDKGNSFHSSHDSFHSCLNKTPLPGTTTLDPTGSGLTTPLSSPSSTSSLLGIISMSTHLDSEGSKKGEKVENPNERTVIFGTKYFREYYKKYHKIPSLCEFRRAYRNSPYATGEETEENRKRIKKKSL